MGRQGTEIRARADAPGHERSLAEEGLSESPAGGREAMSQRVFAVALGMLLAVGSLAAASPVESKEADGSNQGIPVGVRRVAFDQRLNEQVPADLEFLDENGASV